MTGVIQLRTIHCMQWYHNAGESYPWTLTRVSAATRIICRTLIV